MPLSGVFHFHQMSDLGYHAQDLGRSLMLYRVIDFAQAQCFDRFFLTFRTIDGALDLGYFDLSHNFRYFAPTRRPERNNYP